MQISVVIPAYNEEGAIASVVRNIAEQLGGRHEYEIIVVDDGSTDRTVERAETAGVTHALPLRVVRHTRNKGYGAALRTGFAEVRYDAVCYMDGDGQYDVSDMQALIDALQTHDAVSGVRTVRGDGWLRRIPSRAYRMACFCLFGFSAEDINCGFKMFRREALRGLSLHGMQYSIAIEMLWKMRKKNLKIAFVPVQHMPRSAGRSSVSVRRTLTSVREMIVLRIRG